MTRANDLARNAPEPSVRGCARRSPSRSLALSTANSVLGLRLDRPAGVTQVAPRFFAYRAAYVFGKSGQRLTGRAAAAFKGALVRVKRRQYKGVPHRIGREVGETGRFEERPQFWGFGKREGAGDRLGQARYVPRDHDVDLMIIRALDHGIDRNRRAPAAAQYMPSTPRTRNGDAGGTYL